MSDESGNIININVVIADRSYPLKIRREEEENVRKAAKVVSEKVKDFQQTYAAKDKQDYLAMCSLMFAVDAMDVENKVDISKDAFGDKLEAMEQMLDKALS